jgi:thermostable 8-oxoguanine DNA glycosylase
VVLCSAAAVYEIRDLASFLQLAMLNGRGGYVLTKADYVNILFSHDEFIKFYSADERLIEKARNYMESPVRGLSAMVHSASHDLAAVGVKDLTRHVGRVLAG